MESFPDWVANEIAERGWSVPEAARRSKRGGYEGVSASMIYKVINRQAKPGMKFYEGIARAFGIDKEEVLKRAGELSLPPKPELSGDTPPNREDIKKLLEYYRNLSYEERLRLVEHAKWVYERERAKKRAGK